MTKSIVVDYDLPGSPAKVWRALTEPKLLAAWLMENDISPELGRRFTFRAKPMGDWDGVVQCEVLAVEPQRLLRYSWRGSSLDSIVTWTLAPTATGTRLHLEHTGFADDHAGYPYMDKGWRDMGKRLAELLATLD